MTYVISGSTNTELSMQVLVNAKDDSIHVKLEGFTDIDEATDYAEFLSKNLALLLFETTVIQ